MKELDEITADFEEYAEFCDDEVVAKDCVIKNGKEINGGAQCDMSAGIESALTKIADLSTQTINTEMELSLAAEIVQRKDTLSALEAMAD